MKDLTKANELHNLAMDYADEAFFAQRQGQYERARECFENAYSAEKSAAEQLADTDLEPTRSILFRSAATLALDCGKVREAEKLVAFALAGDPPDDIADELRELFERVNVRRHLDLQGLVLSEDDLQITFAGNAIGKGFGPRKEIFSRVNELEKLIHRTDQRIKRRNFGETVAPTKKIVLFVSLPKAASFSFTLRFGLFKQLHLPYFEEESSDTKVIDEVLTNLELLEHGNLKELQKHISDPAYFRNFVGLARNIAPDGNIISFVGLTASSHGKERKVSFSRNREDIWEPPVESIGEPDYELSETMETVSGVLRFANEMKSNREIRLEVEGGQAWKVLVREGLMEDIVGPHWGQKVNVLGRKVKRRQKTLLLSDIVQPSESAPKLL